MRNLKILFLKQIDTISIFVLAFFYSFFLFSKTCKLFLQNGFDYQALFVWEYNAFYGQLPYKDVFYPYGVLSYYKDHAILAHFIYLFVLPIVLGSIYFFLKKAFENRSISLLVFSLFVLFVGIFTGWEVFNRYGVLVAASFYFADFLSKKLKRNARSFFIPGVISGLCFSLATDIGIYTLFIFLFLLIMHPVIEKTFHKYESLDFWLGLFKKLLVIFFGFCVGSLPLFVYLFISNSIYDFSLSFLSLSEIALYAKTPFLPSLRSLENIFTFSILFLGVFLLSYKIIWKKSVSYLTIFEFVLILVIVMLEQKNIIRSIDRTITFVAFLLLCFLFYELFFYLKNFLFKQKNFANVHISLLMFFAFILGMITYKDHAYKPSISRIFASDSSCVQKNTVFFKTEEYRRVLTELKNQKDFDGKIFSFPSDPIFYVFLHQKTPFFSNTYDASSRNAQAKQIEFLKAESISYIVVNTKIKAIQDGVPEYIRANELMKYIHINYYPISRAGDFLIMKKSSSDVDIFTNSFVPSSYRNYLLDIDLKAIPYSEGLYKYQKLNKPLKAFSSFSSLNTFIKTREFDSKNSLLALFFSENKDTDTDLIISIKRNDGITSNIRFKRCKNTPCLINLSRLPLFFAADKKYTYEFLTSTDIERIELFRNTLNSVW